MPRKTGRPSKYADGYSVGFPELGFRLALLGAVDEEIAEAFDISLRTLMNWKVAHPELARKINEGKTIANANVAHSLYQRAMGYEHDDIDIRVVSGEIVQTKIRKYYAPDPTSCIFFLKNREPKHWRDKVETGITDRDGKDVIPADPMEGARRIAFVLANAAITRAKETADG